MMVGSRWPCCNKGRSTVRQQIGRLFAACHGRCGACTLLSVVDVLLFTCAHLYSAGCMPCPIVLFFKLAHCMLHALPQPIHSPLYLRIVTPCRQLDMTAAEHQPLLVPLVASTLGHYTLSHSLTLPTAAGTAPPGHHPGACAAGLSGNQQRASDGSCPKGCCGCCGLP